MIRFSHEPDGRAIRHPSEAFNPKINHVIASVTSTGKLLGGVTYDNFSGASINIHVRSFAPNWLTRDFLWVIFHYPFVQLKCRKVLGFVASTNQKALAFDLRVGFKEEYRISDACVGGDLVVLSMRKEDCKWLNWSPRGSNK